MQRWKEEFVGNTQRKRVHVHHNGDFEHGKGKTLMIFLLLTSTNLHSISIVYGTRLGPLGVFECSQPEAGDGTSSESRI